MTESSYKYLWVNTKALGTPYGKRTSSCNTERNWHSACIRLHHQFISPHISLVIASDPLVTIIGRQGLFIIEQSGVIQQTSVASVRSISHHCH